MGVSNFRLLSLFLFLLSTTAFGMEIRCGNKGLPASTFDNIVIGTTRKINYLRFSDNDLGGHAIYISMNIHIHEIKSNKDNLPKISDGNFIDVFYFYVCNTCFVKNNILMNRDGVPIDILLSRSDPRIFILFGRGDGMYDPPEARAALGKRKIPDIFLSPCLPPKELDDAGKAWLSGTK